MSPQNLFTPIKVGNNLLKHRVVLSPLTRFRATAEAVPTKLMEEYYQQRASEGGLLIAEATFIDRLAGGYLNVPGIYNREQIKGWQKVTSAVHKNKASIFLQLWHLGRVGSKTLNPNGEQIVSASDIPITGTPLVLKEYEVPRALEIHEIKEIIEQYRQAALNAVKEAGFDGIEVHSASGFLPDQFINRNSNKRTDRYGGSIENRSRFVLELIDALVDAVGEERTAIRFSPDSEFHDMQDDTTLETWSYITQQLQKNHPQLAYLHFVEPRGNFVGDTNTVFKDSLQPYRDIWQGPFIAASGFSTTRDYALAYAEKTGNLISFGRAFIANPDLPARLQNGWELNQYDRSTFYTNGAEGYTDYPFYNSKE